MRHVWIAASGGGRCRTWCWAGSGVLLVDRRLWSARSTFGPAASGGGRSRLAAWPRVCPESAFFCSVPSDCGWLWRAE